MRRLPHRTGAVLLVPIERMERRPTLKDPEVLVRYDVAATGEVYERRRTGELRKVKDRILAVGLLQEAEARMREELKRQEARIEEVRVRRREQAKARRALGLEP